SYLSQPIVVTSFYGRTDDTAQLDLYERSNANASANGSGNGGTGSGSSSSGSSTSGSSTSGSSSGGAVYNEFIVADNTALTAVLNETISTKNAKEKDRFTMTVQTPSQYTGAIIEGYVSNITRSGKLLGRASMTFNFERIKLTNDETYNFAGFVQTMKTKSGEVINVDTEGAAQGGNQTTQTATRAGIGTAAGAVIGGITGGTKGAILGAVIGASAGAGSVYIQGRGDLDLASGSTVSVRASAPTATTTNR
ncbi:MAG: hypothetical protein H7Z37_08655, partial [Pyrinomonadaceae bacterium]|nr:hypothetical protein [Pyrinomonadaceae bacterium]